MIKEPSAALDVETIERVGKHTRKVLDEIHRVIIGQDEVIQQMLIAMLCQAHCLVVGVPGLGKTLMVKTLGRICAMQFKRVQFTPDLMPSDILGTEILEEQTGTRQRELKFLKGPIFTNLLLADEINRTPPKTQSALLEAMQENAVTVGGTTYPLPQPFFVLATQNPIEQEGTYPLPEAQLDRFMFNIWINYPSESEEEQIIAATTRPIDVEPKVVIASRDILNLQRLIRAVPVSPHVVKYATRLTRATRPGSDHAPEFIVNFVSWGCGPRAAQYLVLGAKARAVLDGRPNVSCRDVQALAPPVFRHRIFTNFNADAEGVSVEQIIERLLEAVSEPDEKDYR